MTLEGKCTLLIRDHRGRTDYAATARAVLVLVREEQMKATDDVWGETWRKMTDLWWSSQGA